MTTEDTDRIQKAIEEVIDNETADIPPLPLSGMEEARPAGKARDISPASLASASVSSWFFTFMCMNLPVAGWIYLIYLAFSKKKPERRNFARAYLFYKLVFLAISAVILGILVYIGLELLDELLTYMEML